MSLSIDFYIRFFVKNTYFKAIKQKQPQVLTHGCIQYSVIPNLILTLPLAFSLTFRQGAFRRLQREWSAEGRKSALGCCRLRASS